MVNTLVAPSTKAHPLVRKHLSESTTQHPHTPAPNSFPMGATQAYNLVKLLVANSFFLRHTIQIRQTPIRKW